MVRVLDSSDERAVAVRQHSVYGINLDSYCTRQMMLCFSLEQTQPFRVDVMVGNKEILHSTHKILKLGNIVFLNDVLFVPGLL